MTYKRATKNGRLGPLEVAPMRLPGQPTEFDLQVRRLKLNEAGIVKQAADKNLAAWVRQHYRSLYVPEDLLGALNLPSL